MNLIVLLVAVIVAIVGRFGIDIPVEVQEAFIVLIMFIIGLFTPAAFREARYFVTGR